MAYDCSRPVPARPEDDDWLADAWPDLGPLREAAERGELADAVACLAGSSGFRLRADDPLAPLAREVARALTRGWVRGASLRAGRPAVPAGRGVPAAGRRLGGARRPDGSRDVVDDALAAVAGLGSMGRVPRRAGSDELALAVALEALGFCVRPFGGPGGASLVTGRSDGDEPGALR
jgi:hypothetical protein